MALETAIVCMDTSAWMRNGDYVPTRLLAQVDAVHIYIPNKLEMNPENAVGLLTFGGARVEVLVPPTQTEHKLLSVLGTLKAGGQPDLLQALGIGMLALRNRRNKNGGQRLVVFVGSPISASESELKKAGANLRKNNIAVDIVAMGEYEANQAKLDVFMAAVNRTDNSHLLNVPAGISPADILMGSPLLGGFADMGGAAAASAAPGAASTGGGGGAQDFSQFGGIDPSLDPEMAMTLAASLEEFRQRAGADAAAATAAGATAAPAGPEADEDFELQQALALSMQAPPPASAPAPAAASATSASTAAASASAAAPVHDADFVANLLSQAGVDLMDPDVQAALREFGEEGDDDDDDDEDDEDDDDEDDHDMEGQDQHRSGQGQ